MDGYLYRTWYRTDAGLDEQIADPGTFSGLITGQELDSAEIVSVDWSRHGWVEVTYLRRGAGLPVAPKTFTNLVAGPPVRECPAPSLPIRAPSSASSATSSSAAGAA